MLSRFSHPWLFATLWTVARQAPVSLEFSKQAYSSGLPCPSPGNLPNPGSNPHLLWLLHCRQILYFLSHHERFQLRLATLPIETVLNTRFSNCPDQLGCVGKLQITGSLHWNSGVSVWRAASVILLPWPGFETATTGYLYHVWFWNCNYKLSITCPLCKHYTTAVRPQSCNLYHYTVSRDPQEWMWKGN